MVKNARKEKTLELRELVKENDQKLYDFCWYLLNGGPDVDELTLAVFREFGETYRSVFLKRNNADASEVRVKLFQTAWERSREALGYYQAPIGNGRDTRELKGVDEDLLKHWTPKGKKVEGWENLVMERLGRIDPDFRAPVILKDVLKFNDEEVAQILNLRWGVYRHRLHRGRLELKDCLRGRPFTADIKGSPLGLEPSPSH